MSAQRTNSWYIRFMTLCKLLEKHIDRRCPISSINSKIVKYAQKLLVTNSNCIFLIDCLETQQEL
jgi:hypothetical protein